MLSCVSGGDIDMLSNGDVSLYPKIGMLSIGDDLSVRALVNSTALHNAAYALKPFMVSSIHRPDHV
jgi:hypothetical protein